MFEDLNDDMFFNVISKRLPSTFTTAISRLNSDDFFTSSFFRNSVQETVQHLQHHPFLPSKIPSVSFRQRILPSWIDKSGHAQASQKAVALEVATLQQAMKKQAIFANPLR